MGNRKEFFGGINEDEKKTEFVLEFSHLKFPSLLHIFVLNRLYYLRGKISSSSLCHPFSHRTYVMYIAWSWGFSFGSMWKIGTEIDAFTHPPSKMLNSLLGIDLGIFIAFACLALTRKLTIPLLPIFFFWAMAEKELLGGTAILLYIAQRH